MSSVRIKRSYTFSENPQQPVSDGRLRSRSWASPFGPPAQTPSVRDLHLSADSDARLRTANVYQNEGKHPSLRRGPPSRISVHLGTVRPRRQSVNVGTQYGQLQSLFLSPQPSQPTRRRSSSAYHNERGDLISLHGQQEDVLVPRAEHEPGRIGSALSLSQSREDSEEEHDEDHHEDAVVEHLDVIDPQISTVSTLTNAANTIVIPPLSFYSRKTVVVLPRRHSGADNGDRESGQAGQVPEDNLDAHVEELLRNKDKFRRVMRGVWSFVKTPLGIVTAIYGFLVVFWGTALVFFLLKFINFHNRDTQDLWIELSQQILTSLFSITSIGIMPFRIVDTYRIFKIWYYKRKTRILRAKAGLLKLYDEDDLPDPIYDANYVHVLTEEEEIELHYQQHEFKKSQTWYRPHGTQTHRAFPIDIAITICVCSDLNSLFQCMLSACMWSMNRFNRPAWTDATTMAGSFVAGILAGFFIYWGGRKTKRVKEVTDRLHTALAMDFADADATQVSQVAELGRTPKGIEAPSSEDSPDMPVSRTVSNLEC